MADRSLNIRDPQVLVRFDEDDNFEWHHRILLKKIGQGRWVTLTPDHELVVHDLSEERYRVCERGAPFPADNVYAHDDLSKAELDGFRRRAGLQAAILDDGPGEEVEAEVWLVAEADHPRFGAQIGEDDMNDALTLGSKGVVAFEGEEVWIEKVASGGVEEWRKKRRESLGDLRLLGDHRTASGQRHLELRDAVPLFRDTKFVDWPLAGPKVVPEFLKSVSEGPGNLTSYHHEWMRRSGVNEISSAAHEHRILTEALRLGVSLDQLDLSNLASFEQITRRLVQIETAVSRSPKHPDYTGLDLVLATPTSERGQANTRQFDEWLTGRMKDRAQIWKQQRLYKTEFYGRAYGDDGSDDDDGDGAKKARKAGKKKKGAGKGKDSAGSSGGPPGQ